MIKQLSILLAAALLASSIALAATTPVTVPAHTVTLPTPAVTPKPIMLTLSNGQTLSVQPPTIPAGTVTGTEAAYVIQVAGGTTTPPPVACANGAAWCATAKTSSSSIAAGTGAVTISAAFVAAAAASNVTLDIEIWGPNGAKVTEASGQSWQTGQTFAAFQTITKSLTFTPAATDTPGTYSVMLGVNSSTGASLFWQGPALTFAVTPAIVTPPTGGTTTPPGGGTTTPPPAGTLAIAVSGNHLIDQTGKTVQLRGVNISSLESAGLESWTTDPKTGITDYWGGQTPNFAAIKSWGANAVRIPLSEAIWNGGTCLDPGNWSGYGTASIKTDPQGTYHQVVKKALDDATAAGLYVIIDLHFTAPGAYCPEMQAQFADTEHSLTFWASIADTFNAYPNVLAELFNEPFADQQPIALGLGETIASAINTGNATFSNLWMPSGGQIQINWAPAGFQEMLDILRAHKFKGPILTSDNAYASDTGDWLKNHPTDSLVPSQVAAVWHAYPAGVGALYTLVNCIKINAEDEAACSARTKASAQAILAAGYPVIITEYGDNIGQSQFSQMLLPFADAAGMSYMAWTWDVWNSPAFVLITDASGTPNPYGAYVKQHYLCRAAGTC